MTQFRLSHLRVENYRCFETLELPLEEDVTVFFAENGGGKTALLTALAMGLAVVQKGSPKTLKLDARRDPRKRTLDEKGRREPVGRCTVTWTAAVGEVESVEWSTTVQPASGRSTNRHRPILEAIEKVRVPGDRWPLFAWYGVDRMQRSRGRPLRDERVRDRWEAYASSLDPRLDEAQLLQWLQDEMLGDVARQRQGEPERFFDKAVMEAAVRATPGVVNAWYDPVEQSPMVRFEAGHVAPWSELSDGYHAFIALVADIARRAVMLNEIDGADAPQRLEGVVLIDEIDLHLHPRWQRVALAGLRTAFPRLQLVVTTHSPQVLSSAENRQVRRLVDGTLQDHDVFVQGRDSNAILRDLMRTDDRGEEGTRALRDLHDAIDRGDRAEAERLYAILAARWGETDPTLIRVRGFMGWGE
ncbi:MAG: AAA family ATPase [Candidatus Rokubacteria bacterium]|nr:AAA family ATPase [Candidatus Rokubacteria bacterium]